LTATLADRYFILAIEDAMTYRMWRLSEAGPGNLGLACTDDGLLFGRTPLIERRNGRFAVRERDEIERLLQHGHRYIGEADRLMPGLAVVARALNADDPCLARIAAVQLKLPDLPNEAARAAMEAEDSLIKYARDEGGSTDWDPALHPRTGTPPNPGWFAPTDGGHDSPGVHVAENQLDSRRTDAAPATNSERVNLAPEYGIDRRAETGPPGTKDKPLGGEFWSNVRAAVTNWLQEMCPNMTSKAAGWWANGRGGKPLRLMWAFLSLQGPCSAARQSVCQRFYQLLVSAAVRLKPARWRRREQVRRARLSPLSPKSKPISA
jgi:hypothetical protein